MRHGRRDERWGDRGSFAWKDLPPEGKGLSGFDAFRVGLRMLGWSVGLAVGVWVVLLSLRGCA